MKVTIVMSGETAGQTPRQLPAIHTSLLPRPVAAQVRQSIRYLKGLIAVRKEAPPDTEIRRYDIRVEHDNGEKDHMIFTDRDNLNTPSFIVLLTIAGMNR